MVALMMVLMFVDSMAGLFFQSRIKGSYELVQCMLCILVFSSWAYTQTVHGHINVVMFVRMMPHKVRFVCYGLTSIFSAVTMGFGSYGVFQMIQDKISNGEATGTLLIPYWPFYVFELAAFVMLTVVLLCDAIKAVAAIFDNDFAEEVMSSWT
jgi:TRAP-type C4-dicarboxylate transport system permease small subunit